MKRKRAAPRTAAGTKRHSRELLAHAAVGVAVCGAVLIFAVSPDGSVLHRILGLLLAAAIVLHLVTPVSPELPLELRQRREGERFLAWCLMSGIGAMLVTTDDPLPGVSGALALLFGAPIVGLHLKRFWATRDAALRARSGAVVPPALSGRQGLRVEVCVPGRRLLLRQQLRWWSHLYLLCAAVLCGLAAWSLWNDIIKLTDPNLLYLTFLVVALSWLWLRDFRRQSQFADFRREESLQFGRAGQRRVLPWSDLSRARVVLGEVRPLATNEGAPKPLLEISVLMKGDVSGKPGNPEWIRVLRSIDESPPEVEEQATFLEAALGELWAPQPRNSKSR
ncbi:MAG: hypothetical protein KDI37_15715 [Xanthomonadales bacterium]|nr:hypothetical protein [Xanthomonadales bacterium]